MVVTTSNKQEPGPADNERAEPPTSLSGWRRFVEKDVTDFDLVSLERWQDMADEERAVYDEARIDHHSELQVVRTSAVREVAHQGRLLTLLNRREEGARRGLIISGERTTGKTTALKQLGRLHELRVRQRYPGGRRIPVVYVTAPPKGSARKLAMEFARFLGLPSITPRANTTDVTNAVCQILIEARTDLVLVEIYLMNLATTAGEELSDHLKYFTEHLPAAFVYAGIDVEHSGLFTGIRGDQIAGRCTLLHTGPFLKGPEWEGSWTRRQERRGHTSVPATAAGAVADRLRGRTGGLSGHEEIDLCGGGRTSGLGTGPRGCGRARRA
ncbi:TniB family NTP-binding protein [Streptomyces sp. NPDC101062]|uniref:TniB family NTP-binding protein n=1 Tax=unclassified Streptomyces TaxID=2593676 RepID=UPI00382EA350